MTIPGRRYTISGGGYSTEGTIKHVFGPPDVPLEQFLLPMALCADAVVKDGELVGDPTEGALVVLAEKGGLDVVETRRAYPRVAELPFDAEYKLMATFHEMQDESGRDVVRCLVKGAPDQLLARASFRPAPRGPLDRAGRRGLQAALHGRERAARAPGPARDGDRTEGLRSGRVRSVRRPASAARRADGARPGRDRRSRRGRRRRRRSRSRTRPGSGCA